MARRRIWEIPVLRREEETGTHRPVTWLELFFDLYFVVIIAALAHNLAGDFNWHGVKDFLLTFLPVWWIWIGFTYYNERFETNGIENRLFTFLLMLAIGSMAVYSHHALAENFKGYASSYIVARVIIISLWLYATIYNPVFKKVGIRFLIGFCAGLTLLVASLFVSSWMALTLFGLALLVEILSPLTTVEESKKLPPFSSSKLPERFGLFTIIVLGEAVAGTINGLKGHHHLDGHLALLGILGIAIGMGMWWIYFDFIGRRPAKADMVNQFGWGYLHMPLVMAFTIMGAALLAILSNDEMWYTNAKIALPAAAGAALISMSFIEPLLKRDKDEMTHHYMSPLLKFLSGLGCIGLAFYANGINAKLLMTSLFLLLAINMFYGAYAWFTQDLDDDDYEQELDFEPVD